MGFDRAECARRLYPVGRRQAMRLGGKSGLSLFVAHVLDGRVTEDGIEGVILEESTEIARVTIDAAIVERVADRGWEPGRLTSVMWKS